MTALGSIARADLRIEFGYDLADPGFLAVQRRDAVKLPRVSIAKLMVVVGIVAFNLGSTRFWSHSSDPSLLTGRILTSIALQVGLYGLIRSRRSRSLPFWAGFETFGLVAAIISVYIDFFSPNDSVLADLMDAYLFNAYKTAEVVCLALKDPYYRSTMTARLSLHDGSFTDNLLFEIVSFLPQLLIALIGGSMTSLFIQCSGKRRDPVVLGPAD